MSSPSPPSTCFSCTRLNSSTFLIVEDDIFNEQPFIYAKIYNSAIVLIDTGCGGAARDDTVDLRSLRKFIETYPIDGNDGKPLNPGSEKAYAVICTHCHYDHIGAIAQFADREKCTIWASANDKSFLSEENLPTNSLCRFVGMETPYYQITNWVEDGEEVKLSSSSPPQDEKQDLGLVLYHTPGHTPDELAIWDPAERHLFVGDTLYEWAPIIFPPQGNLNEYTATLYKLRDLIKSWNNDNSSTQEQQQRVRMGCGHVTRDVDAEEFVVEVERFLSKVRRGLVEPQDKGETRGYRLVGYEQEDGRISFLGPKQLFDGFLVNECPV